MPIVFSIFKYLFIFGSTLKIGSIFMRNLVYKIFLRKSIYKSGMQVNLKRNFIFCRNFLPKNYNIITVEF